MATTAEPPEVEPIVESIVEGGDSACWAHLVCPDCGRIVDDVHPSLIRCGADAE